MGSSVVCGLLCRFMGTRFVASTTDHMICAVGVHASPCSVRARVRFGTTSISMIITITQASGSHSTKASHFDHATTHSHVNVVGIDNAIVFTAAVARWACPQLMRTTFLQVPRAGLKGCNSITSLTIAAAAMTYSGQGGAEYNVQSHRASCGRVSLAFWPRHITASHGAVTKVVHIPVSVCSRVFHDGSFYVYSECAVFAPDDVDEILVQTCRALQQCVMRQ